MDCNCKWLLGFFVGLIFLLVAVTYKKVYTTVETTFNACINDSDCSVKGHGFACFQYICYPWADDTAIPAKDR